MRIEITINGKTEYREIPTKWEQVTFKTFLALTESGDNSVKIVSALTGIDPEVIRKARIKNLDEILLILSFLKSDPPVIIPKSVLGYEVPKDLGFETIGQYEDLREYLKNTKELSKKELLEKYTLLCAVYACKHMNLMRCEELFIKLNKPEKPIVVGQYDWRKAEEMANEFLEAPAPEVLSIGNFTYLKLIGLSKPVAPNSRSRNTLMKKFKLVLTAYRLRLAFMVRSFTWKKKPAISETS